VLLIEGARSETSSPACRGGQASHRFNARRVIQAMTITPGATSNAPGSGTAAEGRVCVALVSWAAEWPAPAGSGLTTTGAGRTRTLVQSSPAAGDSGDSGVGGVPGGPGDGAGSCGLLDCSGKGVAASVVGVQLGAAHVTAVANASVTPAPANPRNEIRIESAQAKK
jgi:hypothetical protein